MIAWINFMTLIVGGGLMTALYLMSVRPAALEKKIGPRPINAAAGIVW